MEHRIKEAEISPGERQTALDDGNYRHRDRNTPVPHHQPGAKPDTKEADKDADEFRRRKTQPDPEERPEGSPEPAASRPQLIHEGLLDTTEVLGLAFNEKQDIRVPTMLAMFYAILQQQTAQIAAIREMMEAEHAVTVVERIAERTAAKAYMSQHEQAKKEAHPWRANNDLQSNIR